MAANRLGIAAAQQGRLAEAVAFFREAVRLNPKHFEAHNNLGRALLQSGFSSEAISHFQRALALHADYPEAHSHLGKALKKERQLELAIVHFRRAASLRPNDPGLHFDLGLALAQHRKYDEAAAAYRKAVSLRSDYADAHVGLGLVLVEQGQRSEATAVANAIERLAGQLSPRSEFMLGVLCAKCELADVADKHLRRYLERDPGDRYGARMMLARLGVSPPPQRASDALINRIYADRANNWDAAIANTAHTYRGDFLVASALAQSIGEDGIPLAILDAGCGTGLVGARIKRHAAQLDGIDLSAAMLARAREKGLYDGLHQGDLVAFMMARPSSYDAIVSAATLIHFGDLRTVFEAAAQTLRDGGRFVFTLFPNTNDDAVDVHPVLSLAHGGCYVHGRQYVARNAKAAGFSVESLQEDVHEYYEGQPLPGLIVVLRRNAK